jgi:hypothetical protein
VDPAGVSAVTLQQPHSNGCSTRDQTQQQQQQQQQQQLLFLLQKAALG